MKVASKTAIVCWRSAKSLNRWKRPDNGRVTCPRLPTWNHAPEVIGHKRKRGWFHVLPVAGARKALLDSGDSWQAEVHWLVRQFLELCRVDFIPPLLEWHETHGCQLKSI